jgi:hypothetical protein
MIWEGADKEEVWFRGVKVEEIVEVTPEGKPNWKLWIRSL